jgi:hypothetical protein
MGNAPPNGNHTGGPKRGAKGSNSSPHKFFKDIVDPFFHGLLNAAWVVKLSIVMN